MKKTALLVICFLLFACVSVSADAHIPVLLYHDLQPSYTSDKAATTITPQRFEEHISALLKNGYTPVSFEDVYNASAGMFKMPAKPVIISFDDGYDTNYKYAFPIIKKYKVKTTIFVVAKTVGKVLDTSVHFGWNEAKIMQQSGLVSIQSHTYDHKNLVTLDDFQLERELRLSKLIIEKNLGTKCNVVAFPYGSCNQKVIDAAKRAGYIVTAQVGETGTNSVANAGKVPFRRITAYGSWTGSDVLRIIQAYAKL